MKNNFVELESLFENERSQNTVLLASTQAAI